MNVVLSIDNKKSQLKKIKQQLGFDPIFTWIIDLNIINFLTIATTKPRN